jgi:hypothetical protein
LGFVDSKSKLKCIASYFWVLDSLVSAFLFMEAGCCCSCLWFLLTVSALMIVVVLVVFARIYNGFSYLFYAWFLICWVLLRFVVIFFICCSCCFLIIFICSGFFYCLICCSGCFLIIFICSKYFCCFLFDLGWEREISCCFDGEMSCWRWRSWVNEFEEDEDQIGFDEL